MMNRILLSLLSVCLSGLASAATPVELTGHFDCKVVGQSVTTLNEGRYEIASKFSDSPSTGSRVRLDYTMSVDAGDVMTFSVRSKSGFIFNTFPLPVLKRKNTNWVMTENGTFARNYSSGSAINLSENVILSKESDLRSVLIERYYKSDWHVQFNQQSIVRGKIQIGLTSLDCRHSSNRLTEMIDLIKTRQ